MMLYVLMELENERMYDLNVKPTAVFPTTAAAAAAADLIDFLQDQSNLHVLGRYFEQIDFEVSGLVILGLLQEFVLSFPRM
jgi:hypothetical protein